MLLTSSEIDPAEFERATGWSIKPQGACKGEVCVPLGTAAPDAKLLSERLGMPLVHDLNHGISALGPSTVGGRALDTAEFPHLVLPDASGNDFDFASLRGQKVLLLAWASW